MIYNSTGPGYWEHGHPPCMECLAYHNYVGKLREIVADLLSEAQGNKVSGCWEDTIKEAKSILEGDPSRKFFS